MFKFLMIVNWSICPISTFSFVLFTLSISLSIYLFCFFRATPTAYRRYRARGQIGAVAAGLCYSHSNVGSEPHLQPTQQLTAMPDP